MKTVNIILMNHHPMMLQVLVEHLAAADNVVPEILLPPAEYSVPYSTAGKACAVEYHWLLGGFSYYKALRKADTAQLRFPFWARPGRK